jgi:hypothetical protein
MEPIGKKFESVGPTEVGQNNSPMYRPVDKIDE